MDWKVKELKAFLRKQSNVIIASQVDADDMQDSVVIGSKIKAKYAKLRKIFSFGSSKRHGVISMQYWVEKFNVDQSVRTFHSVFWLPPNLQKSRFTPTSLRSPTTSQPNIAY